MTKNTLASYANKVLFSLIVIIGAAAFTGCSDDWYENGEETVEPTQGETGPMGPQGPAGNDGMSPLVHTTSFDDGEYPNLCSGSGTYVTYYYDDDGVQGFSNGDSVIDEDYLCDGVDGEDGVDGVSCTVTSPQSGVYVMVCGDGSSVTWTDGETGPMGPQGPAGQDGSNGNDGTNGTNGQDGSSCTVVDNGDGTATMSCTDGTSVTWETEVTIVDPEPECTLNIECPGTETFLGCIDDEGSASMQVPACIEGTCGFEVIVGSSDSCVVEPEPEEWEVSITVMDPLSREVEVHLYHENPTPGESDGTFALAPHTFDLSEVEACTWAGGIELAARSLPTPSTGPWWGCNAGTPELNELEVYVNGELIPNAYVSHDHACGGNGPGNLVITRAQLGCPGS